MNIIFIGTLCPPNLYEECCDKHYLFDSASTALQKSVIKGFGANVKLTISFPNILASDKKVLEEERYKEDSINNISVKCINVPGVKQIISPYFANKHINNLDFVPDVVFVYAIQSHTLKIASLIKHKFPHCKVILMIPDLAEFMSSNTSFLYLQMKKLESKIVNKYLKIVDGYVLLSEFMTERLPIKPKPYIVVEGIWSGHCEVKNQRDIVSNDKFKILYSGTLALRYGISTLVEAFRLLQNKDLELIICGKGDGEEYVKKTAAIDTRIKYLGQLTRNEVLDLQTKVNLLVNPRSSEGEFTKYSFPSKTIEYLASGTPTLLCKLPAIPREYYKHCFAIDDMTPICLKNAINSIYNKPKRELVKYGLDAQKFIFEEKNIRKQGNRILSFIKSIN